jgi:DNA-binding response OmpR family regulator
VRYLEGTGPYGDRARFPLPDLVVLDLKLPNKSGLEVLGWLRSTPTLNGLRVVVLTSSSEEADIDAAYGLGVESYLVKPVGFEELRVRVEALAAYWGDLEGGPAPLAPFATPPTDGLPGS